MVEPVLSGMHKGVYIAYPLSASAWTASRCRLPSARASATAPRSVGAYAASQLQRHVSFENFSLIAVSMIRKEDLTILKTCHPYYPGRSVTKRLLPIKSLRKYPGRHQMQNWLGLGSQPAPSGTDLGSHLQYTTV